MNEADIKALKPRDADYIIGIGDGLLIRVRATGRKIFIVRRKQAGKTRIITLAPDWPNLSLKDAIKRNVNAKTPSGATVNDLIQQYHEAVICNHARPKQFTVLERRISQAIGSVRVSEMAAGHAWIPPELSNLDNVTYRVTLSRD